MNMFYRPLINTLFMFNLYIYKTCIVAPLLCPAVLVSFIPHVEPPGLQLYHPLKISINYTLNILPTYAYYSVAILVHIAFFLHIQ